MSGESRSETSFEAAEGQVSQSVLLYVLLTALMVTGLLWPVEESVAGIGLQWVMLWAVVGVFAVLRGIRFPLPSLRGLKSFQPAALADLGCLLIPVGQFVSTVGVFVRGGDCRAALNLSFEWGGLLVGWWILRSAMQETALRKDLGVIVVAMMTGIAAFGIWQHHVIYPEQAGWYQGLRSELDELLKNGGPGSSLRINEIRQELLVNQIPLEGSERQLWENRVLNSTEPTGTFALANTFSGLLVAAILLVVASVMERFRELRNDSWKSHIGLSIVTGVLCYALILSKSRTAWVGLLVGVGWLLLWSPSNRIGNRIRKVIVIAGLIIAGSAGLAVASGALDKEVILEAPKSLQYRLFYWTGTMGVIREHPILGTGPGNFRQAYLEYKVPESSEEIRDPHNWILEAWVSGGFASLLGTLLLLATLVVLFFRPGQLTATPDSLPLNSEKHLELSTPGNHVQRSSKTTRSTSGPATTQPRRTRRRTLTDLAVIGMIAGFLAHAGWAFVAGDSITGDAFERLWIPAVVFFSCRTGCLQGVTWTVRGGCAVLLGMSVHLLGAGGFQMTAPMFMIFAGVAAAIATPATQRLPTKFQPFAILLGLMIVVGFGSGVLWQGLLPVTRGRTWESAGRYFFSRGQVTEALKQFEAAISADPISPGLRQRLSEVYAYRLSQVRVQNGDAQDRSEFIESLGKKAVRVSEELIFADSRSTAGYRIKAQCEREMYRITEGLPWLESSIGSFQEVVDLYPTSISDVRSLAETARLSADSSHQELARKSAKRALEMDELNRSWGHQDLYLTEEQQNSLREILQQVP